MIPSSIIYVMESNQAKGQAFFIAAKRIVVMFLEIRITVANVDKSARLESFVAMELVPMLVSIKTIVANAIKNARLGFNATTDLVVMLEIYQIL